MDRQRHPPRRRGFDALRLAGVLGFLLLGGGISPALARAPLGGAVAGAVLAQASAPSALAPVLGEKSPDAIPGQYLVVFKPGTPRTVVLAAQEQVRGLDGKVGFTYASALVGFSARLPPKALEAIRATPGVEYVEVDQRVVLDTVQNNPPDGLDRTSERLLPLDQRYTYSETGLGVHAYVIDRGIDITHAEFAGRALGLSTTFVTDAYGVSDCPVGPATGTVGHGTFVAGIIAGATVGIAKQVTLHSVRVADCSGTVASNATLAAGIDWVVGHVELPAVANISVGSSVSSVINTAVRNAVAANVTVVVSAGNLKMDACQRSPASEPLAITVGAVDPTTDTLWQNPNVPGFGSNFGPCVDLFAPGYNIRSADISGSTATRLDQGTSFAAPHVTGVAARYLQNHPSATPAAVWTAIQAASNLFPSTPGWLGIANLPPNTNTPNRLLHWGSLNDGFNDGDPHLTTVDGIHYDFQGAGEFVALRDGAGLEIQTRQTPVATTFDPGPNPYTGLATCVSLNTAVAARVGTHRVTYQPNLSGVPDPSGLQLRVDGALVALGPAGVDLGLDGRVARSPDGSGLEIDFPDGTVLIVTPGWWASQGKWYLNLSVFHTAASQGIMGAIAAGSWLPALPGGASTGPMPAALHDRYLVLNRTFADAWRVTAGTSLFDYAPGTSTATFTLQGWPLEQPPCLLPESKPVEPASEEVARRACREVSGKNRREDCVFDVRVTGNTGFAKTYLRSQELQARSTTSTVTADQATTQVGEWVTFTASVVPSASGRKGVPAGMVQFIVDGTRVGAPIKLDPKGRATWETSRLKAGSHRVVARYLPSPGSAFLASASLETLHPVVRCACEPGKDRR